MTARAHRSLRGFLLHHEHINVDNLEANDSAAGNSSYTQQGGRPGLPSAGDALGSYLPRAHHAQESDLDIIALRPGIPRLDDGGGLGYRVSGDADDLYRGWCEPNMVLGYRPVEFTTTSIWANVAAVTIPDTQTVVVLGADSTATEPISYWRWAPATRTWTNRAEIDSTSAADIPALCILRSGRVLAWLGDSADGSAAVWYSDDDGVTWEELAPHAMRPGTIDGTVLQARIVEDVHGNLLLVAVAQSSGDLWQYASDDGGANWELVETVATLVESPVSLARNLEGQLLLVYVDAATSDVYRRILADAYDPISTATAAAIDGTNNAGYAELAFDSDGMAYVVISVDSSDQVKVRRSLDGGANWAGYTDGVIQGGGGLASPTNHQHRVRAAVCTGGELLALFTSAHVPSQPSSGSLISLWLGGWSNVEQLEANGTRGGRRSWGDASDTDRNFIFLPTSLLADYGWTHTGAVATLADGYHRYNPSAATSYDTLTAPTNTASFGALLVEVIVVSGGSVADESCAIRHNRRNGATQTVLSIRCSTTQFRVRDESGAGATIETVDLDMTSPVQFLVVYKNATSVVILYKRPQATRWITGPSATLGTDATGSSTDVYRVGCIDSTTSDMRVGLIASCNKTFAMGIASSSTLSARMRWGKQGTVVPYPVRELADTSGRITHLSASGGPSRYHETWSVPASWDYGVRSVHPIETPSPAAKWRSVDTSEQRLVWDLGADGRLGMSWAEALCLVGANFRQAVLEVSTNAAPTTWVELGTYDARVVDSGSYVLDGNLLRPASGTARGTRYFADGDLRHGFVTLDPGGTPKNRRIRNNSSGGWVGSGMQTAIELEGVDGTEPTSGTLHVAAPGGVLVCHRAAPTAYRRVRLRIPTQQCPDAYFELGNLALGSLCVAGQQWSRGWSMRWVPLVREEEDEAGTVYVEPTTDDEQGCYRRELTVAWQDGYTDAAIREQIAGYLAAGTGTPPLAAERDVWRQLIGLLRRSKGGKLPSVALLEIPPATTTITDPSMWIYGRLGVGQSAQANNVQGQEGRDEIYRFESLTHVELL